MGTHGIFKVPPARNEPVRGFEPGSPERASLQAHLDRMAGERIEVPLVIGGKDVFTGTTRPAVMPHDREHVLADVHQGGADQVAAAIEAAAEAWKDWSRWPWEERASVFLRAAELLAGPWRDTLNAATMLGQSKTAHQAEIDAACELVDFLRFNVEFMTRIYSEQPVSGPGVWNRMEYRPLEGFVFAVSPFNFTAIAGNLTSSAALMGNVVLWKPASTAMLSRALPDAPLAGSRAPGRRDQPRLRAGRRDRRRGAREPRPRRDPLHRLDRRVQRDVADGRREHGPLPQLPADRRRDGRQGLHRRPPLRRPRRRRDRGRARLVRVPGAEVLGGVAGLRARRTSGRRCGSGSPRRSRRSRSATSPTSRTSWAP